MHLDRIYSDDGVVAEVGRRVAIHRLARNLTQDDFAKRAGVGRSTVQRIERGASIQLTSFVKVLRVLDRLDALDAVLASEIRSPLAELERERARRQRARHGHGKTADEPAKAESGQWVWGDAEREE